LAQAQNAQQGFLDAEKLTLAFMFLFRAVAQRFF